MIYFSRSVIPERRENDGRVKKFLKILEQRFVKGEIELVEFEERKRAILEEESE